MSRCVDKVCREFNGLGHIELALVPSPTYLDRGHARIVPPSHEPSLHELEEFPFGQDGV